MASVKLIHVHKYYEKQVHAIQDANVDIRDKEFVVLVGPSGCGKTTLLRMIAGLEEISEGEIYIGDRLVNNVQPKDRDIAMVFQNYALYPHMTVYDNMAFGLKLRKFSKPEIDKRVRDAARLLELENYLDRKPKALSGGQRQRVALGRAIVRKPQVFLFDEPLSNLDAKLRVQMRIEINKLHHRLKATMIYVTHDQVEAMTMGNRIVVMRDGLIQQVGSPLELYNHPVNIFVAGFIGSPAMNFIEGELIVNKGDMQFRSSSAIVDLEPVWITKLKAKNIKKVVLGVRPENLILSKADQASGNNHLKAEVEVVEPMGSETFCYLKSGELLLTMRSASHTDLKPGQKVRITLDTDHIHLFDKTTEKSLAL